MFLKNNASRTGDKAFSSHSRSLPPKAPTRERMRFSLNQNSVVDLMIGGQRKMEVTSPGDGASDLENRVGERTGGGMSTQRLRRKHPHQGSAIGGVGKVLPGGGLTYEKRGGALAGGARGICGVCAAPRDHGGICN